MTPAELRQFQLECFARIDFRLAYRLARRVAKWDQEALRELNAWQRDGFSIFRAKMCLFDRRGVDRLLALPDLPLKQRIHLRRRRVA